MRKALTVIGILFVAAYSLAIFMPVEPVDQRPGTRLSGEPAAGQPADWEGRRQIFVETRTWYLIRHSVTTTAWSRDGIIYVPCGACDSKRWPKNVAADPRVHLKIDGRLYQRTAQRITDQEDIRSILSGSDSAHPPEGVAVFRMNE